MRKLLRIAVPASQVLAFIGLGVLSAYPGRNDRIYFDVFLPAKNIVAQLNYPLTASGHFIALALERSPLPNPSDGVVFAVLVVVGRIVLLACVALFWYLVISELELRREGRSYLHFSHRVGALVAVAVLLSFAVGAVFSAYRDATVRLPSVLRDGSRMGFFITVIPELLLVAWAVLLVGLAVADLKKLLTTP